MPSKEDMEFVAAKWHIDEDDSRAAAVGEKIAEMFCLSPVAPKNRGLYRTEYGLKKLAGLARVVLEILKEEGKYEGAYGNSEETFVK